MQLGGPGAWLPGLLCVTARAQAQNLALVARGCKAFSNGDAAEGPAGAALADYSPAGSWSSALGDQVGPDRPAIWGGEFAHPECISKVVVRGQAQSGRVGEDRVLASGGRVVGAQPARGRGREGDSAVGDVGREPAGSGGIRPRGAQEGRAPC